MGLLIITCLTQNPDIFFLSFGKGERLARYGDVDSHQNTVINSSTPLNLNYHREGNSVVEILKGEPTKGFNFCLVEQDEAGSGSLGVWNLS